MPTITVDLRISPKELLKFYQGIAKVIVAPATTGQRVQLPVAALRPFVTSNGVQGRFEIHFCDTGKLIDINQISKFT